MTVMEVKPEQSNKPQMVTQLMTDMVVEPVLQEKLQVDIQPMTSTVLKQEPTKLILTEQQLIITNMDKRPEL